MGKVIAEMSMSLDGFITGPTDSAESLFAGVDRLHQWIYGLASWRAPHGLEGGETNADDEIMAESWQNTGAILMGHRMFEHGEEPWGDNPPFHVPVFVVTHHAREPLVKAGGTTFFFVTDGVASAMEQAKAAAGDKDVSVAGGANVIQQLLRAGLLDEIQLHLIPVLLGTGTRLFEDTGSDPIELECTRVVASANVTHLRFRAAT
ncbi:MAG: dihydrofolate reductase family protein [Chloroflexi bacterium]|nr:dihydrofolate reductase family protein [Chloroflexota bacterium]